MQIPENVTQSHPTCYNLLSVVGTIPDKKRRITKRHKPKHNKTIHKTTTLLNQTEEKRANMHMVLGQLDGRSRDWR